MSYVAPFSVIKDRFTFSGKNGNVQATIAYEELRDVLKLCVRAVEVDEEWYRETYPDVANSIDAGVFKSAKHHFVEEGYFEGRLPSPIQVDEAYYVETYPDIARGIDEGLITSPSEHFLKFGYAEGRIPAAAY